MVELIETIWSVCESSCRTRLSARQGPCSSLGCFLSLNRTSPGGHWSAPRSSPLSALAVVEKSTREHSHNGRVDEEGHDERNRTMELYLQASSTARGRFRLIFRL